MLSDKIEFYPINFEAQMPSLQEKFDLAICLEVAEHLSEKRASILVETICASSDVVLFGAAIKGQGGTNHINEQWQSYWIKTFKQNQFLCFDVIRGAMWNNPEVKWWYTQNTFLFIRNGSKCIQIEEIQKRITPIYDIVHPRLYQNKILKLKKNRLRRVLQNLMNNLIHRP